MNLSGMCVLQIFPPLPWWPLCFAGGSLWYIEIKQMLLFSFLKWQDTLREWYKTNKHSVHNLVLLPERVYQFFALTNYRKLGSLKQRKCVMSQRHMLTFWKEASRSVVETSVRQHLSNGAKGSMFLCLLWLLKVSHVARLMALNSSSEQTVLCYLQGLYQKTPFLISEEKSFGDLLGKFGFIQIIQIMCPGQITLPVSSIWHVK